MHEKGIPPELDLVVGERYELVIDLIGPRGPVAKVRSLYRESIMVAKSATELFEERRASEERVADKKAAREIRRQLIRSREPVYVRDSDSKVWKGLPVSGSEWECLEEGTPCVLFSLNPESGEWEEALEHFVVEKKGGQPKRSARVTPVMLEQEGGQSNRSVPVAPVTAVTAVASTKEVLTRPESKRIGIFLVGGQRILAPIFSPTETRALLQLGPKEGLAQVATELPNQGGYILGLLEKGASRLKKVEAECINVVNLATAV